MRRGAACRRRDERLDSWRQRASLKNPTEKNPVSCRFQQMRPDAGSRRRTRRCQSERQNGRKYKPVSYTHLELNEYGIDKLRFGALVFLQDCDTVFGREYLKGSGTVGVVIHSDCLISGHGPGVTTVLSCKTERLSAFVDENANIGKMLGAVK